MASSPPSLVVKTHYNGDIRRVVLSNLSFEALQVKDHRSLPNRQNVTSVYGCMYVCVSAFVVDGC
jgi:hypothetical protein